jgi:phosphoribosylamine--glycine ligase
MTTQPADSAGLVGKDGRTAAMAAKCAESPAEPRLDAMAEAMIPTLVEYCEGRVHLGDLNDAGAILRWAEEIRPSVVLVGPEEPLAAGAVDVITTRLGIPCFGPTQALARIESSKAWARDLVARHGIPGNPAYRIFRSSVGLVQHLAALGEFVLKPDGLTGGKGVKVYPEHFESFDDARRYAEDVLDADGMVIVEERLDGEEFSLQTITDGVTVVHCPVVQDHKRASEGDTGPNTGGMGSYSCADFSLPFLRPEELRAAQAINEQVIAAMFEETGERYRGVLYGGFMVTAAGVRLIEYNCRFGDPEALNVLPLMSSDFFEMACAVAEGRLADVEVRFEPQATVCKYIVPAGYPSGKGKGDLVEVPQSVLSDPSVRVYWAACNWSETGITMTGSRAVGIVGIGNTLDEAEQHAERAASQVVGEVRFRHDIGTADLVARRVEHMDRLRVRASALPQR